MPGEILGEDGKFADLPFAEMGVGLGVGGGEIARRQVTGQFKGNDAVEGIDQVGADGDSVAVVFVG